MSRRTALLLLVANLLFFWPVLFHGHVFSSHDVALASPPWRGMSHVAEPENRLLADPATSGIPMLLAWKHWPHGFFWNPFQGGGIPGLINIVQGNLSPFFWLPAIVLPVAWIETGILFLKFNAGFLFMFVFLRRRKFSDLAAACGAAAWSWTTAEAVWWLWMHTSVSLFFPLLLFAIDLAFEQSRFSRATAIAAFIFLGFLSGGYPYWIVYGAIAGVLYFFFRAPEFALPVNARAVVRLTAAAAVAAAILVSPLLLSARFMKETGVLAGKKGSGEMYAMPLRQIRLYIAPDYKGDTFDDNYEGVGIGPIDNYVETAAGVGALVVGLAIVALAGRKRRRFVLYAIVLGLLVAVPLYGGGIFLRLAGSLPLLSTGLFERMKIVIVFALCLLAAAGAEVAEESFSTRAFGRRVAAALPWIIAVPLIFIDARFYPTRRPAEAVFHDTPGTITLRGIQKRFVSRLAGVGWTMYPDIAQALHLEDVRSHLMHEASYRRLLRGADPNVYGHTGTLLIFQPKTFDPQSPVLDLLGVSAIITAPDVARLDGEQRIYSGPDLAIFARPNPFPRFFAVSRVATGGELEARNASRQVLRTTAFVPVTAAGRLAAMRPGPGSENASVKILDYRPEHFAVAVASRTPVFLASSQKLFEPYWRAFLDGKPATPVLTDGVFFGLPVPAGSHTIEGRFMIPRGEIALLIAALIALAGLLAAAFFPRAKRSEGIGR